MANWQPMTTAPKDGTTVILAVLWYDEIEVALGWFDNQAHHRKPNPFWHTDSTMGVTNDRAATFLGWMPLPKPPTGPVT